MKTLIAYGTKHGCTEKCSELLSERLMGKVDIINLKNGRNIDLEEYDNVIIGGSIYMGKIQKEVNEFTTKHLDILKDKKIGLFICCMRDGELAENELMESFPQELIKDAVVKEYFGGEFIFKKMNFMERLIVKKVSNIDSDTSNLSINKIEEFANKFNAL